MRSSAPAASWLRSLARPLWTRRTAGQATRSARWSWPGGRLPLTSGQPPSSGWNGLWTAWRWHIPERPPAALLRRIRAHLGYVTTLLEVRKTLTEHRRLLTVGSWLSLLAATCMTDLGQRDGASAHLTTA